MKYLIAGGIIVGLAIGGWFLYDPSASSPIEVPIDSSAVSVSSAATLLTPLAADVLVADVDKKWLLTTDVRPIASGVSIKTSAVGRALISREADIVTSIAENTEFVFWEDESGQVTQLELQSGRTWSQIERTLEQDEVYEVYTPTMVAAVRGTSFGVSASGTEAIVVSEGTVAVFARATTTREKIGDPKVLVGAGEVVEVIADEFVVRPITLADRDDWWQTHNQSGGVDETEPVTREPVVVEPELETVPAEPVVVPETEPEVVIPEIVLDPATTTPTTTPALPVITSGPILETVSPRVVTDRTTEGVSLSGSGFTALDAILLNGTEVEFTATSDALAYILTTNIIGEGDFEVTLVSGDVANVFGGAFSVAYTEAARSLLITEVVADTEVVQVIGEGFAIATVVIVNEVAVPFTTVSDTVITFDADAVDVIETVVINGSGLTTNWP